MTQQSIKERLRRHKRRRRLRIFLRLLCIGMVGCGLHFGWNYIHQPDFAFGSVTVHGTNQLTEQKVIEMAGCRETFNFFNASRSRLLEGLSHDIRFQNPRVEYHWPADFEVYVEEREPALYVANSYRSYLQLDYNGLIMNVTVGIPDARAPILVGAKCGNVFLGDKVDNLNVSYVLQFLQRLDGEARDRIAEISIDDRQNIKISLRNSFPVLLGAAETLAGKALLFMAVFNEIKNKNIKAEYIDLTFAKPYIKLIPEQNKK